MLIEDQSAVIAALQKHKTYGSKDKTVLVRHSNISIVFLNADKAYKLKRGVKYAYVDYSTLEKRKEACKREMILCERTAPGLCIGVEAVLQDRKGRFYIASVCEDKEASVVDYVLVMNRFDEAMIFENMAEKGLLDRFEMMDLAEKIADLHVAGEVFFDCGGSNMIRGRIMENDGLLRCFVPSIFDMSDIDDLKKNALEALEKYGPLLDERKKGGKVRWCHGDTHFHNIVMRDGKPSIFDPIEFNDELTKIDVLYDLAYLLMDMEDRGLKRLASILFNHYMVLSADWEGVPAFPLFLSCRACVQAYVCAQRSVELEDSDQKKLFAERAYRYLQISRRFLSPPPPVLVACGGLSGSGKSRLTRELAPFIGSPPGAVVLRDDILRKNMFQVSHDRSLGAEAYTPENEEKVYGMLFRECERVLKTGQSVAADALFHNPKYRQEIEELARRLNVRFVGFWADAPLEIRTQRVFSRKRNPSDVKTFDALEAQLSVDVGNVTWEIIDTSGDRSETLDRAQSVLKKGE